MSSRTSVRVRHVGVVLDQRVGASIGDRADDEQDRRPRARNPSAIFLPNVHDCAIDHRSLIDRRAGAGAFTTRQDEARSTTRTRKVADSDDLRARGARGRLARGVNVLRPARGRSPRTLRTPARRLLPPARRQPARRPRWPRSRAGPPGCRRARRPRESRPSPRSSARARDRRRPSACDQAGELARRAAHTRPRRRGRGACRRFLGGDGRAAANASSKACRRSRTVCSNGELVVTSPLRTPGARAGTAR